MNNINLEGALEGTNFAAVGGYSVPNIISTGIQLMLITASVGAFVYLLMGAFAWITSGGSKEGAENARKKITGALIGLAITFSVYVLQSIIGIVFLGDGNAIFNFKIPTLDKIPVSSNNSNQNNSNTSNSGANGSLGCGNNKYVGDFAIGKDGCYKCIGPMEGCKVSINAPIKYGLWGATRSEDGVGQDGTKKSGFYCKVGLLPTAVKKDASCKDN